VVIVTLLLLLSLYLMSSATENSATFDQRYVVLLGINMLGLMMLVLLIAANAWRLIQNYRRAAPGSRLTVRLLSMFILIEKLHTLLLTPMKVQEQDQVSVLWHIEGS